MQERAARQPVILRAEHPAAQHTQLGRIAPRARLRHNGAATAATAAAATAAAASTTAAASTAADATAAAGRRAL